MACAAVAAGTDGGEQADPAGTQSLTLEVGKTAPMTEMAGANVLCDDPSVAAPEYADGGNAILLRGLKAGTTLCGIWIVGPKPGGLYRVHVVSGAGGSPDAGASR